MTTPALVLRFTGGPADGRCLVVAEPATRMWGFRPVVLLSGGVYHLTGTVQDVGDYLYQPIHDRLGLT